MFREFRAIFLGSHTSEAFTEIPLVISVLYYSFTILLARVLRTAVRSTLPQPYQDIAADMVMTFAGCACSLENVMIRNSYGSTAYGVALFTLASWFALTVHDGSKGNPCGNMISFMQGKISLPMMWVRVFFQLLGGLASYTYARNFWYLGLTKGHDLRYTNLHCTTHCTVPVPAGFALEFAATFLDALLVLTTFTPFFVVEMASKLIFSTLMVLAGIHLTGMYMNPVNASNQNFGCEGLSGAEHVLVYWGGPLLAAALAVLVHRHLSDAVTAQRKKLNVTASARIRDRWSDEFSSESNSLSSTHSENDVNGLRNPGSAATNGNRNGELRLRNKTG